MNKKFLGKIAKLMTEMKEEMSSDDDESVDINASTTGDDGVILVHVSKSRSGMGWSAGYLVDKNGNRIEK